MDELVQWWRQRPDRYNWLSAYVHDRGFGALTRLSLAAITLCVGIFPVAMMWSPVGAHGTARQVIAISALALNTAMALFWLCRWPTRSQAAVYSIASIACTAATCLIEADAISALTSCTAFAALGGYIALFLSPPYVVANLAVGLGTAMIVAAEAAMVDPVLAVCRLVLIVILLTGVPFSVQALVHLLAIDVTTAGTDSLTGLLNRRALYRSVLELIARVTPAAENSLTAILVDLDDFKLVNDTAGHAVGDQTLIDVSRVLRETCPPAALVARIGGEEFLVIDVAAPLRGVAIAETLRLEIAALHCRITASIGVTETPIEAPTQVVGKSLVDELIGVADSAMYDAKRAGGNQVVHRCLDGTHPN